MCRCFRCSSISLVVHQRGGNLGLTSDSCPAQRSVLSQDSANGVLVVVQCHGPLGAKTLLVVPHEGAVADLGSCRRCKRHGRRGKRFTLILLIPECRFNMCVGVAALGSELVDWQRNHLMAGSVPASHRRTPASCHREAHLHRLRWRPPPSCLGSCSW